MATSAFKSTTRRTPIGESSSTDDPASSNRGAAGAHRRSRSLSRFSRRIPAPESSENAPVPKQRFVNTLRRSGSPEISLDDLATELFSDEMESERGRLWRRSSNASPSTPAGAAQRRGRSVSRQSSSVGNGQTSGCNNFGRGRSVGNKSASDQNSRRRRSVSVVRYRVPEPESHSSALTDDEAREAYSGKIEIERTIQAVYAQKKTEHPTRDDVNNGLYEAMRVELRRAVKEIKKELEQAKLRPKSSVVPSDDYVRSSNADVFQAVSTIGSNYASKLEQSASRKHNLLAEILMEEECRRELSKIGMELLPDHENTAVIQKPLRTRKRTNDRNRMSKRLTEEAEKYLEDFISNVEDTDISSFDGERSDGCSTVGGTTTQFGDLDTQSPAKSESVSVEMDGLVLPWLQWETSNDGSTSCKIRAHSPMNLKAILQDVAQEERTMEDQSNYSASSRGSWSPVVINSPSMDASEVTSSKFREHQSYQTKSTSLGGTRKLEYDIEHHLNLQNSEDLLYETLKQQHRINSGCLLLCNKLFI